MPKVRTLLLASIALRAYLDPNPDSLSTDPEQLAYVMIGDQPIFDFQMPRIFDCIHFKILETYPDFRHFQTIYNDLNYTSEREVIEFQLSILNHFGDSLNLEPFTEDEYTPIGGVEEMRMQMNRDGIEGEVQETEINGNRAIVIMRKLEDES